MKLTIFFTLIFFALNSCNDSGQTTGQDFVPSSLITFVELGSVNCIPCQKMQPIMKSLEERYGSEQLEVIFIDILLDPQAAEPYKVKAMPTQVFLDKQGIEIHRHVGFYPEDSIDIFLESQGLEPLD